jgi:nanoRNase/pAp phosphatase (c-di-AMP/oligoRNAs hydrolase)
MDAVGRTARNRVGVGVREGVGVIEPDLTEPQVVAGIALVLAALVVLVYGLHLWLGRTPASRFRSALAAADEVAILTHPNPDPDAMASALGVASLAGTVDTDATIQFPGGIRHQENRAFRTVLEVDMERIEERDDLAADRVVLVDHNVPRGFEGAGGLDPYAVVDHHPGDGTGERVTDVRPEYGACATIVAEYLETLDVSVGNGETGTETLPNRVATGMVFGIQADTERLTRGCSPHEFEAAGYLYPGVDEDQLSRVANPQVPEEVLLTKSRAIQNKEIRGSFAVSDLGAVPNVDAISQAADELMYLEGVTAVIVVGEYNGTLHLSGRSRDDRVHMGNAVRSVVSDIPMADGGGHARMAGGQVSVDHMEGIGPSNGLTRGEFVDRLFDSMAGEE